MFIFDTMKNFKVSTLVFLHHQKYMVGKNEGAIERSNFAYYE